MRECVLARSKRGVLLFGMEICRAASEGEAFEADVHVDCGCKVNRDAACRFEIWDLASLSGCGEYVDW